MYPTLGDIYKRTPPAPVRRVQHNQENIETKDPRLWGPWLWNYLHCSGANYPVWADDSTREQMKNYLCSMVVSIPCENCSKHYKTYIDSRHNELDEICLSRENLFKFLVDIHNWVNKRSGKPEMSLVEAKKRYKYSNI